MEGQADLGDNDAMYVRMYICMYVCMYVCIYKKTGSWYLKECVDE